MSTLINELNQLNGDWSRVKNIYPYGAGLDAHRTLIKIVRDFNVPFIADADVQKENQYLCGKQIRRASALLDMKRKGIWDTDASKIVVTIARRRYDDIKQILEEYGYVENIDFCHLSQFVVEWYLKYKNQYCIYTLDIAITSVCTLKCRNCNMFTTWYKVPYVSSFDEFKNNVDLLFSRIDYIFTIGILGGEALQNPDVEKMVEYLYTHYSSQYGGLVITTNGVVLPTNKQINFIKKYINAIAISDYSNAIGAHSLAEKEKKQLELNGIDCFVRKDLVWCNFGWPIEEINIPVKDAREHMLGCNPGWRGLAEGRLYYCNCAWSAEKTGMYTSEKDDYVDLSEIGEDLEDSKRKLLEYCMGNIAKGYMSFCRHCRGCGPDNKYYVDAGEQV